MSTSTTGSAGYTAGYQPGGYPSGAGAQHSLTEQYADRVSQAVEENPAGTLLSAFGAGLGIGAIIGLAFAFSAPRPKPRSRAEELGQRLLESLHDYVPDSVARRFN